MDLYTLRFEYMDMLYTKDEMKNIDLLFLLNIILRNFNSLQNFLTEFAPMVLFFSEEED